MPTTNMCTLASWSALFLGMKGISSGAKCGLPMSTVIWPSANTFSTMMPRMVSTITEVLSVKPCSVTYLAKQRAPLPHCSTSLPSALKMRYLKSQRSFSDVSITSNWSKPMPVWRSDHVLMLSAVQSMGWFKALMTIKSLPKPCILVKFKVVMVLTVGQNRRLSLWHKLPRQHSVCGGIRKDCGFIIAINVYRPLASSHKRPVNTQILTNGCFRSCPVKDANLPLSPRARGKCASAPYLSDTASLRQFPHTTSHPSHAK